MAGTYPTERPRLALLSGHCPRPFYGYPVEISSPGFSHVDTAAPRLHSFLPLGIFVVYASSRRIVGKPGQFSADDPS